MSAGIDLARLEAIIDASGVPARIEAMLPAGVRPRQLSVRSLMLGILICLAEHRPAHLRRVHRALIGLPENEKHRLGVIAAWKSAPHELSYRQVERTFSLIVKTLAKDHPDGAPSEALSETIDALTQASVTVLGGGRAPQSGSYAIDWSDYESFARAPHKDGACADPEGWWGHRKVNHPAKAQMFFGYYLQAATIVASENEPPVPELIARITLASCKHDPPQQIVPVIRRIRKDGIPLGEIILDSGYAYRAPETFAIPMRALGAKLVMDLHPNDRGIKGTHQGAIACNGNLYCPATPKALFELSPLSPGANEQQTLAHDARCAELAHYKLSPLSTPDKDGYRRLACPAVKDKLRCPHRPASMSLSHKRPTITSPPEHPPTCCTQKTITVAPSVNAKTSQKHDYPSASHRRSYNRRTAAERTFSRLNNPAATNTSRGWSRLMGLTGNALMLACAAITTNIATTEAFTARQAEDQRRAETGLPPRRRRRRRETPHQLTAHANAPPTITA